MFFSGGAKEISITLNSSINIAILVFTLAVSRGMRIFRLKLQNKLIPLKKLGFLFLTKPCALR
jgi:hypothetical protein